MASKTVNYQLTKPDETDFYDIAVQNENMDRIDSAIKNIAAAGIAYAGTATNTGNTYSIDTPAISALVEGMAVSFKCGTDSSGATSLNWNQKGNKAILKSNGLAVSNLKAGSIYTVRYNGTAFILQGEGGEYGTATPDKILTGYTLGTESGLENGTMPNRGSVGTVNLTSEGSEYIIQEGYHNGLGKVKAVIPDLMASVIKAGTTVGGILGTFTSDAAAVASQMLSGATAYVNGNKITGTIPSKAAQTYTPTTVDQTISAGQYLSGAQTIAGDADLIAANIKDTVNLFGVVGTYKGNVAEGLIASDTNGRITVGGLAFKPKNIVVIDPIWGGYFSIYNEANSSGHIFLNSTWRTLLETGSSIGSNGFVLMHGRASASVRWFAVG